MIPLEGQVDKRNFFWWRFGVVAKRVVGVANEGGGRVLSSMVIQKDGDGSCC